MRPAVPSPLSSSPSRCCQDAHGCWDGSVPQDGVLRLAPRGISSAGVHLSLATDPSWSLFLWLSPFLEVTRVAPKVWTPWDPAQGPRSVVTPAQGNVPKWPQPSWSSPPSSVCSVAALTPPCLSPPSPPTSLICCSAPRASRCVINNLEPVFMDSAISAAFQPITFLQRLHEGFLLSQLFCFIYSLLPASRRCAGTCCLQRVPGGGPGGIWGA